MADRPIIFSAPMVLALLAGRKTQTRRLFILKNGRPNPMARWNAGDRLWVRESYRHWKGSASGKTACYVADGEWFDHGSGWRGKPDGIIWCSPAKPSIHMPRWASRLTLIVEAVRVEPLVRISDSDCIAEGINDAGAAVPSYRRFWISLGPEKTIISAHPAECYAHLWSELHSAAGQRWSDNPDVVALTFSVHHSNIDRMPT